MVRQGENTTRTFINVYRVMRNLAYFAREFNSRRLHQIEFRSAADVARCAATVDSANGIQCLLKETVKV
jgi:hypothetical protein